ncbi:MAG: GtrA family protein [Clostridia bacterium]|nr:GtrA family protein [Clostridia bacterium]
MTKDGKARYNEKALKEPSGGAGERRVREVRDKIGTLWGKYREVILYLLFGAATTLVNLVVFYLLDFLRIHYLAATIAAWFVSVLFAYLTNRKFVFRSEAHTAKGILNEALLFFAGRGLSGLLDFGLMALGVEVFRWDERIWKIPVNILVIVLNYVISKILVFRKKKEEKDEE